MSTSADFEAAQGRVKTLTSTPSPDELLELYALRVFGRALTNDARNYRAAGVCGS